MPSSATSPMTLVDAMERDMAGTIATKADLLL
jgi:hypothetical protein